MKNNSVTRCIIFHWIKILKIGWEHTIDPKKANLPKWQNAAKKVIKDNNETFKDSALFTKKDLLRSFSPW
jgi:hypothetical protein